MVPEWLGEAPLCHQAEAVCKQQHLAPGQGRCGDRVQVRLYQLWGCMTSSPVLVRRIDKISVRTNPLSKVVVTDNWIVLVGAWPWSLQLRYAQCTDVQQVAITLLSSATSQM